MSDLTVSPAISAPIALETTVGSRMQILLDIEKFMTSGDMGLTTETTH